MQRKSYSLEFKQQVVQEVKEVGNASQVARRHGIASKLVYQWIKQSKHSGWQNASSNAKKIQAYTPSPQEFHELETKVDTLKKLLGEKDLEIEILRDLLKKSNPAYRTKLK